MIVLISAQKPTIDSLADDRFGRAAWLIRYDTHTNAWEALANPGAAESGGAGVASAQFAIDQHADVVIAGAFGPHAANACRAAHITMRTFTPEVATVSQALEELQRDRLPVYA
jgi:predicted Fe-Mo cluster-binding NifX family protein